MPLRCRRWLWHWLPALLFMTLIFALSSIPGNRIRIPAKISDKLVHAAFYFVLCLLIFRGLRATCNRRLFRYAPLAALVITSIYGALDETYQGFTGRNSDVADWLADTIGAAAATVFLLIYAELRPDPPKECDRESSPTKSDSPQ